MLYLSILCCKFEKVLSYVQHPQICHKTKFRAKLKILNFGTMSDLSVFEAAILKNNYCDISN